MFEAGDFDAEELPIFQSIHVDEIFGLQKAQASESYSCYWLAQLRKEDWYKLLKYLDVKVSRSLRKQELAAIALQRLDFKVCNSRDEVWRVWLEIRRASRGLVIQFRHPETNWFYGRAQFVDLEMDDPLCMVNIAGRSFCRIKRIHL